ncbi:MAG: MBL fold metallo-hydrolase [Pseudomonadota bacterium]|nr:MBL fold metallo-hydrolase [Pseudomonadota bacterium]
MRPQFFDLGHDVVCVDSGYQRPGLAAIYLVVEGGRAAVIDTGTANSLPYVVQSLEHRGIAPEAVAYVMPTHVHLDHAGGAGALVRAFRNAQLVLHPRGVRHMVDPSRLIESATAVYGEAEFERLFGTLPPVAEDRILVAEDELVLDLNGRRLQILDTPGHARHHYCVYDERSRGLFTGDTFGLSYPEVEGGDAPFIFPTTTPVQFDPVAWGQTLDRFLTYPAKRMYLTHFGKLENVNRMSDDLRRRIEAHVEIAKAAGEAQNRENRILDDLRDYLVSELRRCGSATSPERALSIYGMDLKLNAQGLGVWLDRSR